MRSFNIEGELINITVGGPPPPIEQVASRFSDSLQGFKVVHRSIEEIQVRHGNAVVYCYDLENKISIGSWSMAGAFWTMMSLYLDLEDISNNEFFAYWKDCRPTAGPTSKIVHIHFVKPLLPGLDGNMERFSYSLDIQGG